MFALLRGRRAKDVYTLAPSLRVFRVVTVILE